MQAIDPFTGKPFKKAKQTQRFATRENQVRFNNQKATEQRRNLSPYLKVLYRNRKILQGVLGDKSERQVTKDFLQGAGYSFRFQTHTLEQNGQMVFGVFEYGLIRLQSGMFKVIRLKPVVGMGTDDSNSPLK